MATDIVHIQSPSHRSAGSSSGSTGSGSGSSGNGTVLAMHDDTPNDDYHSSSSFASTSQSSSAAISQPPTLIRQVSPPADPHHSLLAAARSPHRRSSTSSSLSDIQAIVDIAEEKHPPASSSSCSSPAAGPISASVTLRSGHSLLVARDERDVGVCRICLEEGSNDLISPCRCRGSQQFVHRSCLDSWRATHTDGQAFTHCGICHFEYVLHRYDETAVETRKRLIRFRCYVLRDMTAFILLVNAVVFGLSALVLVCDTKGNLRAALPSALTGNYYLTYYLCGWFLFLALLGICGMIAVVVGWSTSPSGSNDYCPCSWYYCYCGECDCGGGDEAYVCLLLALLLVVILAFVGVFFGIFLSSVMLKKILQRHVRSLWLREQTQVWCVEDFWGKELPAERLQEAENRSKEKLKEDEERRAKERAEEERNQRFSYYYDEEGRLRQYVVQGNEEEERKKRERNELHAGAYFETTDAARQRQVVRAPTHEGVEMQPIVSQQTLAIPTQSTMTANSLSPAIASGATNSARLQIHQSRASISIVPERHVSEVRLLQGPAVELSHSESKSGADRRQTSTPLPGQLQPEQPDSARSETSSPTLPSGAAAAVESNSNGRERVSISRNGAQVVTDNAMDQLLAPSTS